MRTLTLLASLAFCLVAAFLVGRGAQGQDGAENTALPGQDIAFVNMIELFNRYQAFQDARSEALQRRKTNERTVTRERVKLAELENLVDEVAIGGPMQRALAIEIASLKAKIENLETWYDNNYRRQMREVQISHYRKVLDAIERYAKRRGLRAVLRYAPPIWPDKDPAGRLSDAEIELLMSTNQTLYAQSLPGVDITNAMIEELAKTP